MSATAFQRMRREAAQRAAEKQKESGEQNARKSPLPAERPRSGKRGK